MTFAELERTLGDVHQLKLRDKATVIRRDGADCIAVRYYNSDIVKYYRDGSCELGSDGLRKKTLKSRMNKYMPDGYSVVQKKGKWIMKTPEGEKEFSDYSRFNITQRDDKIGKELDKKVYAEGRKDNTTMANSKKRITLEEATIAQAQANYHRFFPELYEAGGMGGPVAPQDDPGQAAAGTFPPPGANPPPDAEVKGPKTSDVDTTPGAGGGRGQEIKDEIYDIMKDEIGTSEDFLNKYFEAKGYKKEDVKDALKQLEDEGKIHSKNTYMVSVEDSGAEDNEKDEAGVTPDTTEPDMAGPTGAANSPSAGAEGTGMPAPAGNMMPNYMDDDDSEVEGDDAEMDDNDEDQDMEDDELEGDEDHLPDLEDGGDEDDFGGEPEYGAEHEEDEMDAVGEIEDDIRDAQALLKSIMSRLSNIRGEHPKEMGSEMDDKMGGKGDDMDMAAMRNRGASAKNPMRRNAMMDDSDFGKYPAWGEKRRG